MNEWETKKKDEIVKLERVDVVLFIFYDTSKFVFIMNTDEGTTRGVTNRLNSYLAHMEASTGLVKP